MRPVALWFAVAVVVAAGVARAADAAAPSALVREQGGVRIDWSAGELRATAGAAADPRMPNVAAARPGAERRARSAATARLRNALSALPLGGGRKLEAADIDRAIERATTVSLEWQSNGGAVITVAVHFRDWLATGPDAGVVDPVVLAVPRMPLEAAPVVKLGGRDVASGSATYRLGAPPAEVHAVPARRDPSGHLIVQGEPSMADRLAGRPVLIYVEKLMK